MILQQVMGKICNLEQGKEVCNSSPKTPSTPCCRGAQRYFGYARLGLWMRKPASSWRQMWGVGFAH